MKTSFEPEDLETLTIRVLESLKPYLMRLGKDRQEDGILDVQGLCDYLKVAPK